MKYKKTYWISTIILCGLLLFSASIYLFNHDMAVEAYTKLGYPTYLIYPSALAKIAGVIIILSRRFDKLKEWVYAVFTMILGLGTLAHIMVGDSQYPAALIGLIALLISYKTDKK